MSKLDKWFESHAPSFVALGAPTRKIKFSGRTIPFNDLRRQFVEKVIANDGRGAKLIWNQLKAEFGCKPTRGSQRRDVEVAIAWLHEKLGRKPTAPEVHKLLRDWDGNLYAICCRLHHIAAPA